MTAKENETLVPPRSRTRLSSPSQPRPNQAAFCLDAISELLQRHKNDDRPEYSGSQTDPDDTDISINSAIQLIAEIAAIVNDYQRGKLFARSGIAGDDVEEIRLEGGPSVPAALISRVREPIEVSHSC